MLLSLGLPSVTVPVLSRTTVSAKAIACSASPLLYKTPSSAPRPVPTIIAVGVARPSEQGQATTSTETNIFKTNSISLPHSAQIIAETTAMTITTGTKTPATLSASFAIGAFLPWASSTMRIICASAVSPPTFVAVNTIRPSPFMLPPVTPLPTSSVTGRLSPVSILRSALDAPEVTVPSQGKRSPGRTVITSPSRSSDTGTSPVSPWRVTSAVSGASSVRARIASEVWRLLRASRYLPSMTSVITTAALSKNRFSE